MLVTCYERPVFLFQYTYSLKWFTFITTFLCVLQVKTTVIKNIAKRCRCIDEQDSVVRVL